MHITTLYADGLANAGRIQTPRERAVFEGAVAPLLRYLDGGPGPAWQTMARRVRLATTPRDVLALVEGVRDWLRWTGQLRLVAGERDDLATTMALLADDAAVRRGLLQLYGLDDVQRRRYRSLAPPLAARRGRDLAAQVRRQDDDDDASVGLDELGPLAYTAAAGLWRERQQGRPGSVVLRPRARPALGADDRLARQVLY
jgi:hypothetical protein